MMAVHLAHAAHWALQQLPWQLLLESTHQVVAHGALFELWAAAGWQAQHTIVPMREAAVADVCSSAHTHARAHMQCIKTLSASMQPRWVPPTWNKSRPHYAIKAWTCHDCRFTSRSCSCVFEAPPRRLFTSAPIAFEGPAPSPEGVHMSLPVTRSRSDMASTYYNRGPLDLVVSATERTSRLNGTV